MPSPSYVISRMSPRSISSASSRTLQPAQLWPPERTETCQPRSPASRTPSTTSWSAAGEQHRRRRAVGRLAAVEDASDGGLGSPVAARDHDHARSTSSTRLPSGSATNAKRTPGSGDGRGETFSVAPAVQRAREHRLDVRRADREVPVAARRERRERRLRRQPAVRRRMLEQLQPAAARQPQHQPADPARQLERDLALEPESAAVERRGGLEVGHRQARVVERHGRCSTAAEGAPAPQAGAATTVAGPASSRA